MQMRPMGMSLRNDGDIKTVAAYVSSLPRPTPRPGARGRRRRRAARRSTRPAPPATAPTAPGNEQVKAPPLKHASDWYLLAQLKKFKDGQRGLPGDMEGAQMRPQVAMLADEQAMKDVVRTSRR